MRRQAAAEEHPDDMQLHGAVCPLLAVPVSAANCSRCSSNAAMAGTLEDLMTFSKAAGHPGPGLLKIDENCLKFAVQLFEFG